MVSNKQERVMVMTTAFAVTVALVLVARKLTGNVDRRATANVQTKIALKAGKTVAL